MPEGLSAMMLKRQESIREPRPIRPPTPPPTDISIPTPEAEPEGLPNGIPEDKEDDDTEVLFEFLDEEQQPCDIGTDA